MVVEMLLIQGLCENITCPDRVYFRDHMCCPVDKLLIGQFPVEEAYFEHGVNWTEFGPMLN